MDRFSVEIKDLKRGKPLPRQSAIQLLNPFLDHESILRVGGRLGLSDQPFSTKHPALLPSFHPFTRTIMISVHLKLLHGGGQLTLAAVREEYWPINGIRIRAYLKPAHKRAAASKAYISFSTKAVHIELVSDLTTTGFLAAFRRFTSRRGLPAHVHSDNGKKFQGARNELQEICQLLQNDGDKIQSCLANEGIT